MTSFSELQKRRNRLEKESRDLDRQLRLKQAEIDQINKELARPYREAIDKAQRTAWGGKTTRKFGGK